MIGPRSNKFIEVKQPEGVKDLFSLIAFLNDKKQVEKHLNQIAEYTSRANQATSQLAKAEELDRLLADAQNKHREAEETLKEAQNAAELIAENALRDATTAKDNAKKLASDIIKDAEEVRRLVDVGAEELKVAKAQADKKHNQAQALLDSLEVKRKNIEEREAVIVNKEAIIRQLSA